ncbi:MAG: hypothetical protein KDC35_01200 [Acidobacteria bacterium]|nr:hypothetical protein [Acidobacteriota bacterium]
MMRLFTLGLLLINGFHLLAQDDPLHNAMVAFSKGQLFDAEGYLLTYEGEDGQIPRVGHYLADIAIQQDQVAPKQAFFKKRLYRNRFSRGVSLYLLAALAAHENNPTEFAQWATLFINEYYEDDYGFRYYPIYYLARMGGNHQLLLSKGERDWYEAVKRLDEGIDFPAGSGERFPFNALYLLRGGRAFSLPELKTDQMDALYVYRLLQARSALNRGDLRSCANTLNEFVSQPLVGVRSDLRLHYNLVLVDLLEALGEGERAQKLALERQELLARSVFPLVSPSLPKEMDDTQWDQTGMDLVEVGVDGDVRANEPAIVDEEPVIESVDLDEEVAVAQIEGESESIPESDEIFIEQEPVESEADQPVTEESPIATSESETLAMVSDTPPQDQPDASVMTEAEPLTEPDVAVGEATTLTQEPTEERRKVDFVTQSSPSKVDIQKRIERINQDEKTEPVVRADGDGLHAGMKLEAMEKRLLAGRVDGLAEALNSKSLDTAYKTIYAQYLRGLNQLNSGRFGSALDELLDAQQQVQEVPFALLEAKILLALARAYQGERNAAQAEWYRIAASQVVSDPASLPLLEMSDHELRPRPAAESLDAILSRISSEDVVSQVIYYSETDHFNQMRLRAYRQRVLTSNPIISNQLAQIGEDMAGMLQNFAEQAGSALPPRRYNQTLELWHQLWAKTLPIFKEPIIPSVAEIQEQVGLHGRALSFVEGERMLGVVIVSSRQQFTIGLGPKQNFMALNPTEKLAFLESRIGPVWDYHGELWVALSPAYRDPDFVAEMSARVLSPESLRWIYSLQSFVQSVGPSDTTAVFSESSQGAVNAFVQTLPRQGLDWYASPGLSGSLVRRQVGNYQRLVFVTRLVRGVSGLSVSAGIDRFRLLDLIELNRDLSSLVLVEPELRGWPLWLDDLELLQSIGPHAVMLTTGVFEGVADLDPVPHIAVRTGL